MADRQFVGDADATMDLHRALAGELQALADLRLGLADRGLALGIREVELQRRH